MAATGVGVGFCRISGAGAKSDFVALRINRKRIGHGSAAFHAGCYLEPIDRGRLWQRGAGVCHGLPWDFGHQFLAGGLGTGGPVRRHFSQQSIPSGVACRRHRRQRGGIGIAYYEHPVPMATPWTCGYFCHTAMLRVNPYAYKHTDLLNKATGWYTFCARRFRFGNSGYPADRAHRSEPSNIAHRLGRAQHWRQHES